MSGLELGDANIFRYGLFIGNHVVPLIRGQSYERIISIDLMKKHHFGASHLISSKGRRSVIPNIVTPSRLQLFDEIFADVEGVIAVVHKRIFLFNI